MQTHENVESFRKVILGSNRKFGLSFGALFTLFSAWPLFHHHSPRWGFLAAAAILTTVALVRPDWLTPLNRAWFKFGLLLNRIVNPIIMGLMFFAAVTPLGWLMRKTGGDPLNLKLSRSDETYWISRTGEASRRGAMTKQF